MNVALYNTEGKKSGEIALPDSLFGLPSNSSLVHQVYVAQSANRRSGSAQTKIRSEVRGGGKKPWKQKGTGNARTGSIRNPIWRGGGTIFGRSKNQNFTKDINAKMRRKALLTVLSEKARAQKVVVCETLELPEVKTKIAQSMLQNCGVDKSCIVGLGEGEAKTYRALRNIPKTNTIEATKFNVKDVLDKEYVVISQRALEQMEKHFVPSV